MDFFNFEKGVWANQYSNPLNIDFSWLNRLNSLFSNQKPVKAFFTKVSQLLPNVQRQFDLDFGDDYQSKEG